MSPEDLQPGDGLHALQARGLGSDFTINCTWGRGVGHGGGGGKADFVLAPPTLSEKLALKPRLPAKVKTVLGHGEARIIGKEKIGHCADRMTGHRDAGPERTHSGCPGFRAWWFIGLFAS